MKFRIISFLIVGMFLTNPIIALSLFPNTGVADTDYTYNFSFTKYSNCSGVILTNYSEIHTNTRGFGYVNIDISNLSSVPSYLCEYRDGLLRKVHNMSDIVFEVIYARDLNLSNDAIIKGRVNVTGNVTAKYFIGNGSKLTSVCLEDGSNCPAGIADTQKNTSGIYLYNDSDTIYFNETQLNITIDDRSTGLGDNASWNQSHANSLYVDIGGDIITGNLNMSDNNLTTINHVIFTLGEMIDNLVDGWIKITGGLDVRGRINATDWTNVTITESQITDLAHTVDTNAYVNCSTDEVFLGNGSCMSSSTLGGQDNATWNQSFATTLYSLISEPLWSGNQSLVYLKSNPFSFYNSSTIPSYILTTDLPLENKTKSYCGNITGASSNLCTIIDTDTNESSKFNNLTATDCVAGNLVIGIQDNGTVLCVADNTSFTNTNLAYYNNSITWADTQQFNKNLNLTQNITGAHYITADYFVGIYNWIIKIIGSSTKYLSFNGTDLEFNETQLNITIDDRDKDTNVSSICSDDEVLLGQDTSTCVNLNTTIDDRVTDTNASTVCSGTTTYLDGEGNCDNIATAYVNLTGDIMSGNLNMSDKNLTTVDCIIFTNGAEICGV